MISLILAAAVAASPAAPADRKICHKISYLGSRLNSQSVCKSKREWDEIQWEHDQRLREGQIHARTLQDTGP